MAVVEPVIDRYLAIWNEADPTARRALVDQTFTGDATYTDPLMLGAGHANLDQMFDGAQAQLPGARLTLLGEPETHHGWTRFRWQLFMGDGPESLIEGTDIGRVGPDGRFTEVIGFLDKVPAGIGV